MIYVPNPVFIEEKGVFNIISAPKNTIIPTIGMAVSRENDRAVYLADQNTLFYQSLEVFHKRLNLYQWDYHEEILSHLKRSRPSLAIIEYNHYFFNQNQAVIKNTGSELKKLAESSNGTYLLVSAFMDENLQILCECADRVLIMDENNRKKEGDFIFKDRNTGFYVKRQRTISDFYESYHHLSS